MQETAAGGEGVCGAAWEHHAPNAGIFVSSLGMAFCVAFRRENRRLHKTLIGCSGILIHRCRYGKCGG